MDFVSFLGAEADDLRRLVAIFATTMDAEDLRRMMWRDDPGSRLMSGAMTMNPPHTQPPTLLIRTITSII